MTTRERELGLTARSARIRLLPPPRPALAGAPEPGKRPARAALRALEPAPLPELAPRRARPGAASLRLLDRALADDVVPDSLLRAAARHQTWARERHEGGGGVVAQEERLRALVRRMSSGPIAAPAASAEARRFELPPEVHALILGPRRKHSGCLWEPATETLGQAEEAMLALSCLRAQLHDGMRILDLGCGWGSLSLWLAERYPAARITGVSSSRRATAWIEVERDRRGLSNLEVIACDVDHFAPRGGFDRVMSIEMFEHMGNWRELLRRISTWLADDGKAFVHTRTHRTLAYRVEYAWAAERGFTAGLMPSHDLLPRFQDHLVLAERWVEPGAHYARTLRAWLERLDAHADEALALLVAGGRSRREARTVLGGWRLFLLSGAATWSRGGGNRGLISHYLLAPHSG